MFIAVLLLGLVLGNAIILSASLVILFTAVSGLLLEQPRHIRVSMQPIKKSAWVGDVIQVTSEVVIDGGIGEVALVQRLPADFQLLEGNNFRVLWKGLGQKTCLFSYKIRCAKRGKYSIGQIEWESRHMLGLARTRSGNIAGTSAELVVKPKTLNIRRIRGIPGIASCPFPVIDIARIGVPTTDFREIRHYVYGDAVRTINWKATARQAGRATGRPLVNEYEVEGKKAVWVFLDASSSLEIGTNVENAFEYSLEAASGVAFYYLDRGYRVGMYIYHDGGRLFYPECGRKQFNRLLRVLVELGASQGGDDLPRAVDTCRRFILGYNPLCIVVTRLDSQFSDSLTHGVKKMVLLRGGLRRRLPIMVIGVDGYEIIPRNGEYEDNAVRLLHLETRPSVRKLRALGSSVLEWNPRRESFGTALLRQVKTR